MLQSLKRQNSVREFFFISSCSPIGPHKLMISISGNLFVAGMVFGCASFVVSTACKGVPRMHNNQKYHQKLLSPLHVQKNRFALGALGIEAAVAKM